MRPLIATLLAVSTLLILPLTSANARIKADGGLQSPPDRHSVNPFQYHQDAAPTRQIAHKTHRAKRTHIASAHGSTQVQIVSHPAGCPSRAFCGCGASIEVFGRSIRELWLAANWLKFPPAAPAPGMVAVRRHHVFVIREVLGDGRVLAYDANSGGRQTRIHVRSLAGFSVRNPHGRSQYAAAGV
jgi:hypothetical protein